MELWTAFLIGIMGSMHCVGMCGPIAMALPFQSRSRLITAGNVMMYNSGRVISYGLIGLIPGLMGFGFSFAGQQKNLAIVLGIIFILSALFSVNLERRFFSLPLIQKLAHKVKVSMQRLLKTKNQRTFLGIGFVNGFLPCGLVYMALAGALIQDSIFGGTAYMMMFGLGTIPLMVLLSIGGRLISLKNRNVIRRYLPFFMIGLGTLFILRGFHVDLPFNIQMWLENGAPPMCY